MATESTTYAPRPSRTAAALRRASSPSADANAQADSQPERRREDVGEKESSDAASDASPDFFASAARTLPKTSSASLALPAKQVTAAAAASAATPRDGASGCHAPRPTNNRSISFDPNSEIAATLVSRAKTYETKKLAATTRFANANRLVAKTAPLESPRLAANASTNKRCIASAAEKPTSHSASGAATEKNGVSVPRKKSAFESEKFSECVDRSRAGSGSVATDASEPPTSSSRPRRSRSSSDSACASVSGKTPKRSRSRRVPRAFRAATSRR